ncbi:centromere-associated protein E-like isoform X2 [Tribolium madens]|uniref:centromere-associated protein E-like isoform X2 n=1 Tax=Tribolium madens TaxID=41895 RepID=UPI001CF74CF1|nr:centromere-associated protein E-like isoform X2 [Tribolium madens]
MTDKKEFCDPNKCLQKYEYVTKLTSKDICDKRDLKLKEAEKTIANKDVIIKMLKQHVKKLEESYKQNLKETEDFRYKFCLASEQVKKLRSCPIKQKENDLKELKCDLSKWKEQCDEYILCKDRCPGYSSRCSFMQKMKNVEKFMKAHYELLESLVDRISSNNGSTQIEWDAIENIKTNYNKQITTLQEEIIRLREELARAQETVSVNDEEPFVEIKDSILQAYRKSNCELQRKVSLLKDQVPGGAPTLTSEDDESEWGDKRVSFSAKNNLLNFALGQKNNEELQAKLKKNVETVAQAIKENVKPTENKCCGCSTQDVQVQTPEIVKEKISTSCIKKIDVKSEKYVDQSSIKNLTFTEETNNEKLIAPTTTYSDFDTKPKKISITDQPSVMECENNENESFESISASSLENKSFNRMKTPSMFSAGITAAGSREKIIEKNKKSNDSDTDSSKCDSKSLEDEQESKCGCSSELLPPQSNQTSSQNNELNDLTEKLNEIRDKIGNLLETQSHACQELEILKNEMSVTRDSTQTCTENITKLTETIQEQKETFLNNFQEQKIVTDCLTEKNDKIQHELSELKSNVEILFQNMEELRTTCKAEKIIVEESKFEDFEKVEKDTITDKATEEYDNSNDLKPEKKINVPESNQLTEDANLEQLENEYADLKKQSEAKDEKIKCINALISYYSNASKKLSSMCPQQPPGDLQKQIDDHLKSCQFGDDEVHNYIEKVRGENLKLKTTISSVIDHLNKKINEIKGIKDENTSSFCMCIQHHLTSEFTNECGGYQSDISSLSCGACIDDKSPKTKCNAELEIEEIYNVVRNTFAPSTAQTNDSSTSCVCGKNQKSAFPCCCSDCFKSEVNIEDIYRSVLCLCANKDKSLKSEEQSTSNETKKNNEEKDKNPDDRNAETGSKEICIPETCGKSVTCDFGSDYSLMNDLQTYVNYLYQQLNIITNIETRIEDLRNDIQTP